MVNLSNMANGFPLSNIISLMIMGAVPIIFMASTSYIKVSIILSVLRSALGGGQIPSQSISGILSLLISLFTISPIIQSMADRYISSTETRENEKAPNSTLVSNVEFIFEPLLEFMRLNVQTKERVYFYNLEQKRKFQTHRKDEILIPSANIGCEKYDGESLNECLTKKESLPSLVLAYVSGELRIACTLGVYIFIPFLVIDLVVSTLLTGLGMMMVSPVTITLPLKLLIFIMSDGWRILFENLINNYKLPMGFN